MANLHDLTPYDLGTPGDLISSAKESVQRWHVDRQSSQQRQPRPDGQVLQDNADTNLTRYTSRAWRPLDQAITHLHALLELHAAGGGKVWLSTHQVISRAALVGAAKVVYLLHPNSPDERVIRALLLQQAELESMLRALKASRTLTKLAPDPTQPGERSPEVVHSDLARQHAELTEWSKDLEQDLLARGQGPAPAKRGIGDGAVISTAAGSALNHDFRALAATASAWQVGSMAAHASLPWIEHQQKTEAKGNATASLAELLLPPVLLTDAAWQLWEHRRDEPVATTP